MFKVILQNEKKTEIYDRIEIRSIFVKKKGTEHTNSAQTLIGLIDDDRFRNLTHS